MGTAILFYKPAQKTNNKLGYKTDKSKKLKYRFQNY